MNSNVRHRNKTECRYMYLHKMYIVDIYLVILERLLSKVKDGTLPYTNRRIIAILSDILAASQEFMRNQKVK